MRKKLVITVASPHFFRWRSPNAINHMGFRLCFMWEASSQGLQIHCSNSQQKLWLLEATSEFHKHNNSITHQPGKNTFNNMSVKFAGVVNYMPFEYIYIYIYVCIYIYIEQTKRNGKSPKSLKSQPRSSGWWFQPIWKILVKLGIFPK